MRGLSNLQKGICGSRGAAESLPAALVLGEEGEGGKKYTSYHSVSVFGHKLQRGAGGAVNQQNHTRVYSFIFFFKKE